MEPSRLKTLQTVHKARIWLFAAAVLGLVVALAIHWLVPTVARGAAFTVSYSAVLVLGALYLIVHKAKTA